VPFALIYSILRLPTTVLQALLRPSKRVLFPLSTLLRWVTACTAGAVALLLATWSFSLALAQPSVRDILVGTSYESTRISIGVDQTVAYQLYVLKSPDRVVVDLPSVSWTISGNNLPQPGGIVRSVRYGHQSETSSRIIFDLFEPVYVANAMLVDPSGRNKHSLELEFKPLSDYSATFAPETGSTRSASPGLVSLPPSNVHLNNRTEAASALPVRRLSGDLPIPAPRPMAPPRAAEKRVIVLDPGHGGKDPGASKHGLREKDITLASSKELKSALEATGRYEVHLTRSTDTYVKLRDRYEIGRELNADLFISMHADAHSKASARGASVYTLSEKASDDEAAALAKRENKSDIIAGVAATDKSDVLLNILLDLAQRETLNSSAQAAEIVGEELSKTWVTKDKAHRFAGFAVLKAPDMPSLLLEMGYLTNKSDANLLRTSASRRRLIEGMVLAIDRYFATRAL